MSRPGDFHETANALGDGRSAAPQPGLFVLWDKSRLQGEQILEDLQERFDLLRVYEVHWTPARVPRNFERFYSDLDVRGVYHVLNKGAGPFLAVTLLDRQPVLEPRMTSRGLRDVNARFLDAKLHYRDLLGGLGVHCGETEAETTRDTTLLLGEHRLDHVQAVRAPSAPRIETLHQDLAGASGWSSASELFRILNAAVPYVVLGPSDPVEQLRDERVRVEFLTDDYHSLYTVLNARALAGTAPEHGGRFRVSIGGRSVVVGIRRVGDQYLDARWARELISTRVLDPGGFYRPVDRDWFETLVYKAFVQEPRLSAHDKSHIVHKATELGLSGWTPSALEDPRQSKALLDEIMQRRGYSYVRPQDPTVFFNYRTLGYRRSGLRRAAAAVRAGCYSIVRRPVGRLKAGYLRARDRVLLAAPWVRSLRRSRRHDG